ncbi:FadR/GntR family transcriptional regulator [Oceaniglobus trochenteri]|uniref:FadR/GntR family transcriptional regulator n=1 Tax=Oceaniglobus trochenteri TaxID=2763260 RepID=UPI001CFF9228|nr:FCD domain-containing protein [Oceaniglobus trochenteri]
MPPVTTPSKVEPKLSRPVQVAEAIKSWVVEEGLRPGDRLPGEVEMIARFSMSKGTIREAMRILEAQGLIKTRTGPGGGSFVHEVSRERAKALLGNYFYFKDLTIGDIYQLRLALEPELVAGLAGHLPETVLAELEANTAQYSHPARTLDEERRQHVASLRFHAILAAQSDNPLLSFVIDFMVNMLSDLTVHRELYAPPNAELWARGRDYQVRLVMALREGDGGAARAIMKAHMETAWALMRGQEMEMQRRFISE